MTTTTTTMTTAITAAAAASTEQQRRGIGCVVFVGREGAGRARRAVEGGEVVFEGEGVEVKVVVRMGRSEFWAVEG